MQVYICEVAAVRKMCWDSRYMLGGLTKWSFGPFGSFVTGYLLTLLVNMTGIGYYLPLSSLRLWLMAHPFDTISETVRPLPTAPQQMAHKPHSRHSQAPLGTISDDLCVFTGRAWVWVGVQVRLGGRWATFKGFLRGSRGERALPSLYDTHRIHMRYLTGV